MVYSHHAHAMEGSNASGAEVDQLAFLVDRLFDNPTNLDLNFQVMQLQIAEGNLEAAEATLERVLIIDPSSRLARILIAEIQISLGKYASARSVLANLTDNPATPAETRKKAEILVEKIDEATRTTRYSGGVSIYAGQTENAFGRSDEDAILFSDLPFENTTKDKSDQVYGYQAYARLSHDLNYQRPTTLDGGIRFDNRDTHDANLSDIQTLSGDISFSRTSSFHITGGIFSSYSDVNHQDFSRNLGGVASLTTPMFSVANMTTTLTANRSIFMPYSGVSDNPGKSSRAYTGKIEFMKPTGFGSMSLAFSAGITNADSDINDQRFEKVQLSGQTNFSSVALGLSLSRQTMRYEIADLLVSYERQKTSTNEASLSIKRITGQNSVLPNVFPFMNIKIFENDSNIANFNRDGGEIAAGMEVTF